MSGGALIIKPSKGLHFAGTGLNKLFLNMGILSYN